jgi:hypothetical protein
MRRPRLASAVLFDQLQHPERQANGGKSQSASILTIESS